MPAQPPADFASNIELTPAVTATGTNGAYGISATSDDGTGVSGLSTSAVGVVGGSVSGQGVFAASETGTGLLASSGGEFAVQAFGQGSGTDDTSPVSPAAIFAAGGSGCGVVATSNNNAAVFAISTSGPAIIASTEGLAPGVSVTTDTAIGVEVRSNTGTAVVGSTVTSTGVAGSTDTGIGVSANGGTAGIALQVVGKIEVQGNSAGQVTMPAGKKTLNVSNAAATANSLIFMTPLETPTQAFLSIGARSAGSFTIDASTAQTKPTTIGYLIIN